MNVNQIVNCSIGLSVVPASQTGFSVPLLLVDHADVPMDARYRTVTKSSYATDLTASTDAVDWCDALWGQNYNPSQAYIGRWASAATVSKVVFPNAPSTVATYVALTNTAKMKITEEGETGVDITPSFGACTTMAEVCTAIQTAMSGVVASYTCALDALDRIVITSDQAAGASCDTIRVAAPSSGTNLLTTLGTAVYDDGQDAETLGAALTAILAKGLSPAPFIICQRGGSIAQVVAFSTVVNAMEKVLFLVSNDADAKTAATSDFCYQIEALGHNKTYMIYTEHTDQDPDAAIIGEILARADKEGACSLALNPISGCPESGLSNGEVIPLTDDERAYLEAKGCDYLVNPAGSVHACHGLAAGGNEMRIMIGKAYMAEKIATDMYGYLLANEVVTYSDSDIQALKGIVAYWANEMAERKMLDTSTFAWNFPAASDFTAAQKATHTMTLSDVFSSDVQSAVNDITITLAFSI